MPRRRSVCILIARGLGRGWGGVEEGLGRVGEDLDFFVSKSHWKEPVNVP